MAYATSNPPKLLTAGMGENQPALWVYSSADVDTDVDGTDYFTDGDDLGMRVEDFVLVGKNTATLKATLHQVTVVTAGGAATVSAA